MHARHATADDCEGVVACARHYDLAPTDDDRVAALFDMARQSRTMLVVEDQGVIIGFALGLVLPHPFSSFNYLDWIAVFVHPEHRRTFAGASLLRQVLRLSVTIPLDMVKMSAPNSSRLGTLLHRAGFSEAEAVYLRGSRWPSHHS